MVSSSIEEMFNAGAAVAPRNEYPHCADVVTDVASPVVHLVNLRYLADALRGDPVWASDPRMRSSDTFKPEKYAPAVKTIRTGESIYMPWLSYRRGRIRVVDGRHRLYALIDEGFTHVKVACNPWHAAMISTLVEKIDGGPNDDLRP